MYSPLEVIKLSKIYNGKVAVKNISLCIEGNLNQLNQSELVDEALKSFYETNLLISWFQ